MVKSLIYEDLTFFIRKENFNTPKEELINFKVKDASIFYKTEDYDEIVKWGIDVKETLISIEII